MIIDISSIYKKVMTATKNSTVADYSCMSPALVALTQPGEIFDKIAFVISFGTRLYYYRCKVNDVH